MKNSKSVVPLVRVTTRILDYVSLVGSMLILCSLLTFTFHLYRGIRCLAQVQSTPYLPDTWQADQLPPGILAGELNSPSCVCLDVWMIGKGPYLNCGWPKVRDMRPQNPPIMVSLKQGRKGVENALAGGFLAPKSVLQRCFAASFEWFYNVLSVFLPC